MADQSMWTNRIVVGYDGSTTAEHALQWALAEARARGLGITLVHAILPPVTASAFGPGVPAPLDLIDDVRRAAEHELQKAAQAAGGDITTRVDLGSPSGVLIEASTQATLVVIGSRGRGGFAGLLLGSVSDQVAAHAACPVVVVREAPRADAGDVVVGVDGSVIAQEAVEYAFAAASRGGKRLIAVHAWEVPSYDLIVMPDGPAPITLADFGDDELRLTSETLAGFATTYPDVAVEEKVIKGPAVKALLEASANPSLIVVGTRGRGSVMGTLLGSVSRGVLHHAKAPVAVIPARTGS